MHPTTTHTGMHFFAGGQDEEPVYALSDHETEKARYWLPCIDLPTVRTTAEFRLTVRAGHAAFANGVKVSEVSSCFGFGVVVPFVPFLSLLFFIIQSANTINTTDRATP